VDQPLAMKLHQHPNFFDTLRARTSHALRGPMCRPLPATQSIARPERRATAEGKIDLGGTRRGEMPVCTRFGAAQRGQIAAPPSRLEARSCWLRSVLSAPPRAAVRPDAIHLKISYVPGKALA